MKNKFVKNVLIIASGTAGAQAITMLFSPIITRIYGPEAFGVMGTFSAMINIIGPIAALTYPIAIVLPQKERDAKSLMKLSLYISLLFSFISLFLILFFKEEMGGIFNIREVTGYLYFLPLIILFASLMQIMEQWLIRTGQFSVNAKVTFIQSLLVNVGKASIGLFYPLAKVLVFFTAISNGLRSLLMYLFAHNKPNIFKNSTIKKRELKQVMRQYKDFPYFRAPEVFLNSISTGLPILLLTSFFSPVVAGFYTIVRTVLGLPSQLLGKAVGDVFYPRIAEGYNNKEDITALIKKATLYLALIGIVPFGLIIFFGPQLFSFVFGSEWTTSGEYARWIALWSFVGFMNRPSVMALPVLQAQKFHLIYTILMLIIRIGVLILGFIIYKSDIISVALYGISGAILNIGLILITIKICKNKMAANILK